ncbi:DNA methyltransferase [Corynebacterium sp. TAE3-ERU30]|uniref:Eco57I restriction-modification methylase domain-containing protein n=1 Tax=Corynebacterium sp. TAE3-ERU30 TaxID=2849496 RepID=UPI001C476CCE|nr:DNA methyltransferase [Corynebacterium sp. TAE3-ERU30]MBV7282253.1 class I SAM-dependent DNA methyltransferase [Corynebacterium sp. TAE3-ERU30]
MASFDSIANVDEWISDYYLTNDENTKGASFGKRAEDAVKVWKADDKDSASSTSPWGRLTAQRNELQTALSTIDPATPSSVEAAAAAIESACGYPHPAAQEVQSSAGTLAFTGSLQHKTATLRVSPITNIEELVEATPLTLPSLDGAELEWSATKLVTELFLSEEQPAFIVLIAGSWVILAERDSWPLGRYFGVDVALAAERNNTKNRGELQQVCAALAWENITCAPDGSTWWLETLAESREHAVKVSESLRQAIKESIEIIGNDVLDRHREQRLPIDLDGNELAKQSLRYLYRILFLLFAEASPELQILPTGVPEYDEGYGLSNLRDQILIEPPSERAARGTYLYDSLDLLFSLVDQGHDPLDPTAELFDANAGADGLRFRNLAADLFKPDATAYISRVKLSNAALHTVLQNLLLTPETSGRERGFVSYATLGVTQLGQVYEGLMSYTGFIATQELLEVAPHGDPSKGSWVVPESLAATLPPDSFVQERIDDAISGTRTRNRRHKAGSFVYRQSSRDRERSASFYSPPVITEFTVGQAIEELRSSGRISCADDVLNLSICEPAMGSGAFAVEAVNQLAELYITLKQEELDEQIPAESLTEELQKVKASIALHQVYGVDLNRTAVELAEISLWLNTMTADLKAPWFGLHLRHGNSLIGATRSTLSTDALTTKQYLSERPRHHSVQTVSEAIITQRPDPTVSSRVHHFLVPALGWGAASESKDLKAMAPEQIAAMKTWRKSVQKGFSKTHARELAELSERVEVLWRFALVRLRIAEQQARRTINLWGQPEQRSAGAVTRAQIEQELFANLNGSYQRLRLIMNAWNALWFWPLKETELLPSREEWLRMLHHALGRANDALKSGKKQAEGFGFAMDWEDLDFIEDLEFKASGALKYEELLEAHPWLAIVERVSAEQSFFHWDLDFAAVMAEGGFDFQVGNPPWVRPDVDVNGLLAEHDPWFKLAAKPTQKEKQARRESLADNDAVLATMSRGISDSVVVAAVLGDITRYPHLKDQRPDLYRGFIERTWANASDTGVISLIHPESHFTEKKAAALRIGAYRRLRRHWQFINELKLFDVDNHVTYGVHVYSIAVDDPRFLSANSLYHPTSVSDSFKHDGSGILPGFRDENDNWDLRPHRDRIATVDKNTLELWKSVLEDPDTPLLETRMVYTVNTAAAAVLEKLAAADRIGSLGLQFSIGWNETTDKKKGYFDTSWQHPDSWAEAILQGPHLGVSTPMIKQPNPTMKSNKDWSEIDLEAVAEDFIPATSYAFDDSLDQAAINGLFGTWTVDGKKEYASSFSRVGWRNMAATTGFRTLYPALLPPESTHLYTITSAGPMRDESTLAAAFTASSFLVDFYLRSTGTGHIMATVFEVLPLGTENALWPIAARRYLELNCLTRAYAPLWEQITGEEWTPETPLRNAKERWHAQNEIDAIVALSLGISADELCMIYRTQFPVMRRYDQQHLYDAHGRKVPKEIVKLQEKLKPGAELSAAERTWTHPQSEVSYTFDYPFAPLDREADLRAAYEAFSKEL